MPIDQTILLNIHCRDNDACRAVRTALGVNREPSVTKAADKAIEERRIGQMEDRGQEEVRPGRGDTGKQVFGQRGLPNVEISGLIRDLAARGYKPVDAFHRRQPMRDRQTGEIIPGEYKYVVRIVLSCDPGEHPADGFEPEGFIERLAVFLDGKVWRNCHIWENDGNDTINCTGGVDPRCGSWKELRVGSDEGYTHVAKTRAKKAEAAS